MKRIFPVAALALLSLFDEGHAGGLASGAGSRAKIEQAVQAVLDGARLSSHFHADKLPGRSPLVVVTNGLLPGDLRLSKFDKPVVLLDTAPSGERMAVYLEVTGFTITPEKSTMGYSYPVEGVKGRAELHWVNGKWTLGKEHLDEN